MSSSLFINSSSRGGGKGSIGIFNLVNEPTVQDLVQVFGTFGQIDEIEVVPKKENNLTIKKLADKAVVVGSSNNSTTATSSSALSLPSFTPHPKAQLPNGFESKTCAAVVHFVEIEDAEEAAKNVNGMKWGTFGNPEVFVFLLKADKK